VSYTAYSRYTPPSLEQQTLQIPVQNDLLHVLEDDFDVLGVDGRREMVIQHLPRLPLHAGEHRQDELLHVVDRVRIPRELWEVPVDVGLRIGHLLQQQVVLVQEEDDRHVHEYPVVDYRVEDVPRLLQPVRLSVLQQHLVELRRGDEEQYRRHRVEALKPLLSLRPLPADVDEQERNIVYGNRELGDPFRGLAAVEDVFVVGDVVVARHPLQVVQKVFHRIALQSKQTNTSLKRSPRSKRLLIDNPRGSHLFFFGCFKLYGRLKHMCNVAQVVILTFTQSRTNPQIRNIFNIIGVSFDLNRISRNHRCNKNYLHVQNMNKLFRKTSW
jgi:hypothetical protein